MTVRKYPPDRVQVAKSTTYFQNATLDLVTISEMQVVIGRTGTYKAEFNGQFNTELANVTEQAVIDLNALFLDLNDEATTGTMPTFAADTTIYAGVYETAGAINPTGSIDLDGQDAEDPIFIFRSTAGALTAAASCVLNLINGAQASHVFFVIDGAMTLSAGCNVSGTFLGNAAVTLSANAFLNGRATTRGGTVTNSGNINAPVHACPFALGIIEHFAIYSSNGALTNTGASVIVGNVGTHVGTITGFDDASLSGFIYPPNQGASLVKATLYVGSVAQVNSERERTDVIAKEDVVIVDTLTVNKDQVVSVKCINSIGISRWYNRILILTEIEAPI
jgi:hypothetical protein